MQPRTRRYAVIELTRQREAFGWTRRELGARAEVHPNRVGAIENLRVRPYPPELERLARALGYHGDPGGLVEEVRDAQTA
jgi:transcriptional regulator with XRE-family HTH domain